MRSSTRGFGAVMSNASPPPNPVSAAIDSRSPLAQAFARFGRMWSARIGLALLIAYFSIATYAPFITSEVALWWSDEDGLRFPVITDLFNRNSYAKPHHLLFNTLALLLPVHLILWWALGRFAAWTVSQRVLLILGLQVTVMLLCWIPFGSPGGEGGSRRALWDQRQRPTETFRNFQQIRQEGEQSPRALFAPIPHSYSTNFFAYQPMGSVNPETERRFHWGTDDRGADIVARMFFGARISLTIGIVAVGLSMFIGIVLGAVSGYFGGWVDLIIQRMVEIMMAFPTFILVLVVVAMFSRDIYLIMIVFGLTGWAGTTRLVRGEFLAQTGREYVLAAEALGLTKTRIMFRHILPNVLTPLLISAAFGMAGMVLAESSLAFIGMGDDTVPSWGSLLDVGRQQVSYGWLIWIPGLAIFGLVASLNLVGNALREALDPKGDA
ncbi:MAG: ABC transporter permease [Planctomycetota bacterium]|nr:MAG: ABC transporter permease [Planctomycetota bacterium]